MSVTVKRAFLAVFAVVLAAAPLRSHAEELIVSAAASLTDALRAIGKAFEATRPGTMVILNFGASGSLLQQIAKGAPVDVFASADQETMDRAEAESLILKDTRANFVRNKLVIVVPRDSGVALNSLKDLALGSVRRIAIGQPDSVPVGRYARRALVADNLWEPLRAKYIFTQNVRQSLDYVIRGEVDAGFVYLTDARTAPDRLRITLEAAALSDILYPVAVVRDSHNVGVAKEFVAYLLTDQARRWFAQYGFASP
jgi:molybdate transport system substrate-binding protein